MIIQNLKCYKPTRTKRTENERWHQMMGDKEEEKALTDSGKLNTRGRGCQCQTMMQSTGSSPWFAALGLWKAGVVFGAEKDGLIKVKE